MVTLYYIILYRVDIGPFLRVPYTYTIWYSIGWYRLYRLTQYDICITLYRAVLYRSLEASYLPGVFRCKLLYSLETPDSVALHRGGELLGSISRIPGIPAIPRDIPRSWNESLSRKRNIHACTAGSVSTYVAPYGDVNTIIPYNHI